jgi:myo-inositol-1(or 4)-monophosphatase
MVDAHRRAVLAERAARAGGAVAREAFRSDLRVDSKRDKNDLVTETDRDAQRQVIATLVPEFPSDVIVGEEDAVPPVGTGDGVDVTLAESVPDSGDAWVIDPIDGTANFVRGLRIWTCSVAAVVDGEPVGAATYLPAVEDIYTAGPESVTRNGTVLSVSDRTDPETFAVSVLGRWDAATSDQLGALAATTAEQFGDLRRFGSMQSALAFVASGGLDAAFSPYQPNSWDALAGVLLIREAGGTVTDLAGERWTLESDSLVASNGEAHETVLRVVGDAADR